MEYLTLNTGAQMPMVGFGTWTLRGKIGERAVMDAIEVGYRLIDTAQMYQNEAMVGSAVRKSSIERQELFITTKLHSPNAGYAKARAGIERSLNELQMDYVDLMLIHEPYDEAQEMYQALTEAYQAGKVRAIGVSNFHGDFYQEFIRSCGVIPAVNQVESHVYFPRRNLKKILAENGTQMQAWSPFTEGKRPIFREPVLLEIGRRHGKTAAQTALRYLTQLGIGVIPKSAHRERMVENLDIFDFSLTAEEMERIAGLDDGRSLFGWYEE